MERLDCHSQGQYGEFAWRFGHAAPSIPRVQHAHQASQAFKAGCKADARRWLQPSSKLKLDSAGNKASAGIWIGTSLDSLCLVEFAFSAKQRLRVTTSSRACPWRPGALEHYSSFEARTFDYLPTNTLRSWPPHAGSLYLDSRNNVPCGRYPVFYRAGAASAPTKTHTIARRLLTLRNCLSLF
jgi:hypothetical protein